MPRGSKCRKVCAEFEHRIFVPQECVNGIVILTMEEMEALRLCDYEGFDQEEAANRMQISRGTLQRMVYSARKKTAEALCEGKELQIEGGNYEVSNTYCQCKNPCQRCHFLQRGKNTNDMK